MSYSNNATVTFLYTRQWSTCVHSGGEEKMVTVQLSSRAGVLILIPTSRVKEQGTALKLTHVFSALRQRLCLPWGH
jgi:hypothetical protein